MPILLTTAYNPGDADPGKTYPRVKIISFSLVPDDKYLDMQLEYGDVSEGNWVPGVAKRIGKQITGAAFDSLAGGSLPLDANELIYDGASRTLYQWLLDNNIFAGTIE